MKFIFVFAFYLGCCANAFAQTNSLTIPPSSTSQASTPILDIEKICAQKTGHCFDAQINEQEVVEIVDSIEQKQLFAQARQHNINVPEFLWMVKKPVKGEFVFYIIKQAKIFAQAILGPEVDEADVDVYPLQQQKIAAESENEKNWLTEASLPKGKYVLHLQYIGKFKTDQKWVWLEVE